MILESISITIFAIILDFAFGDPKNKYHPTAWIGKIIIITSMIVVLSLFILDVGISLLTTDWMTILISITIGAILLKSTIAIRGMERYALAVMDSLDDDNLDLARTNLSMIVKRNTQNLDKNHIISGVLESVSENTVDGITGPLFYYALFGLPGAFVYRVINTADSMIGYKTDIFKNIGWFAATCDTVLNYIPSRLTGLMMIISSAFLQHNWKDSYKIMMRDGKKTASPNAGYPMAALAGALETKFEKLNHYNLGDVESTLTKKHVKSAIAIMKISSLLFLGIITIPIIIILYFAGWWIHV